MKKILLILIALLLVSTVSAVEQQRIQIHVVDGIADLELEDKDVETIDGDTQYIVPVTIQVQDKVQKQQELSAMSKDKIQERIMQMQKTTERLQTEYNLSCEKQCHFQARVNENNNTEVDQVQEVKLFGLFKAQSVNGFTVDEDGNIVKENKNWIHYFYNWGLAKKYAE